MTNNTLPILDNLPGMIYRCSADENWSFQYVSGGCRFLTGFKQSDLIESKKNSHKSLVYPGDLKMVLNVIKSAIAGGSSYSLRYRIVDSLGVPRQVLEQGRAVMSDSGELLSLEGFIAAAEGTGVAGNSCGNAAMDLHSCEMIKALPDLKFMPDRGGCLLQYKEARGFRLPYAAEKIDGRNINEAFPGNMAAQIRHFAERALQTAEVQNFIFQIPVSGAAREYEARVTISGAADNSMHREKPHRSRSARSSIVQALVKALEAGDFITGGHADRLQDIVEKVARDLGLSDRSITDLRLLAKFHDIGKVGIPDRILFKPGPLTMDEYNEMKRHTEIGRCIAEAAPDLAPIADWILKHHEWWNGEGYPHGLKGDNIPMECRILSMADAYDAMTSDRPYRKAMQHEAAVEEIARCAGSQFDPELVPVFIRSVSGR